MKNKADTPCCRHGDDCSVSKLASNEAPQIVLNAERARMGTNEALVHDILKNSDKPMAAYDILPLLSEKIGHSAAPTTVYRALNHLCAHNIVTRIESRNAYVLCQHPHEKHDCLFFICRACGAATETPDDKVSKLLHKEAEALGFDISRQILEIVGLCKDCAGKQE